MDSPEFAPLLTTTDWNAEWVALQAARNTPDDPAVWDERAKTFSVKHGSQAGYVEQFLHLARIREGETVLDMGCGTGALATPLALEGHRVIACDFSGGMLAKMEEDQRSLGASGVETHLMSWEDDWDAHGVGPGCADVALASRSIATRDLRESLMKLHRAARRRVCLTLPAGPSPKSDPDLLRAAGLSAKVGRDFLYAFNILAAQGISPEVAYIPNSRMEVFESFEDALDTFSDIARSAARGTASSEELAAVPDRLRPWLHDHLVHDTSGYHLHQERRVTWAFIAWDK